MVDKELTVVLLLAIYACKVALRLVGHSALYLVPILLARDVERLVDILQQAVEVVVVDVVRGAFGVDVRGDVGDVVLAKCLENIYIALLGAVDKRMKVILGATLGSVDSGVVVSDICRHCILIVGSDVALGIGRRALMREGVVLLLLLAHRDVVASA